MCAYFSCLCQGALYTPTKFTLTDVSSAHGSDANAGCLSACVEMLSRVKVCDCVGVTNDTTGITLIDGVIPSMLDILQTNWAAQLYTASTIYDNWKIDFLFEDNFLLRQVDLSLFFCPTQMIPNQGLLSIFVYQSILFPTANKGQFLGNISLSVDGQNCENLLNISILTNSELMYMQYFLEFTMENRLGGIYIGEVKFSDEVTLSSLSSK